jgi:hypothetical protein
MKLRRKLKSPPTRWEGSRECWHWETIENWFLRRIVRSRKHMNFITRGGVAVLDDAGYCLDAPEGQCGADVVEVASGWSAFDIEGQREWLRYDFGDASAAELRLVRRAEAGGVEFSDDGVTWRRG